MKIGFIGCGNMSTAFISGIIKNNIYNPEDIIASDINEAQLERISKEQGINVTTNNLEVAKAEIIILAVKPQFYMEAISGIKDIVAENQLIITIAPGKTLQWVEDSFGKNLKIVRTMPNTPALIGEGVTGVCYNKNVTENDMKKVFNILNGIGIVEEVSENLMDVVVSVSGSAPAYVYMFIEAMADAAVADGMPRDKAYRFAAQTVMGSAKMVLETGKHPGELKDMVCSPGGTTIEAVRVLEEKGMRSAVIEAMKACVNKAKGL